MLAPATFLQGDAIPGQSGARTGMAGFSLLEVVVTLAILSLAAAIITVSARPLVERRQADLDRRELSRLFWQARYTALIERRDVRLDEILVARGPAYQTIDSDIVLHANGLCTGSRANADTGRALLAASVDIRDCQLEQVQRLAR